MVVLKYNTIHITGASGSGTTTLAKAIAKNLATPTLILMTFLGRKQKFLSP